MHETEKEKDKTVDYVDILFCLCYTTAYTYTRSDLLGSDKVTNI